MIIRKFAQVTKKTENTASFIASTASSDRYGDVVDQESWLLEAFKKSPVILLNHRQDMLPIGKANSIAVVNGQLEIDVEFDVEDDLGKAVARKVKNGFLNAVSVGFYPKKATNRSDLPMDHFAYSDKGGMFLQDNELLEVSVVTIPANSEAVAKEFALDTASKVSDKELQERIDQIIRTEIFSKTADQLEKIGRVLKVEELADKFIVSFSKSVSSDKTESGKEESENEEIDPNKKLLNFIFQ